MTDTHDTSEPSLTADQRVERLQDALVRFREMLAADPAAPISEILPVVFKLRGKPFSLKDHFPHEPIFRLAEIPRRQITKAGRQVAKSTNQAAASILRASMIPYYNQLTVTPLFEQVRKFSTNYVRPFLVESTVRTHILRPGTDNSVLQRTLANGSNLFYNYASNSADRIRGTAADEMSADEMQDFDLEVLPIIEACLSASPFRIMRFSGTPKTFDNALQVYWENSSQGIWHIPCMTTGCKHINRCSEPGDILKMCVGTPTLVCAKCGQPVNSRMGYYIHDFPERQRSFSGYHMPQVIFPMHYAKPMFWQKIQDDIREKPKFVFYNEILGESIDTGMKLLTMEQVKAAAVTPVHRPRQFKAGDYALSGVGVDWGGKGKEKTADKEEMISNTVAALGGIRNDGHVVIRFVKRLPYEADPYGEAQMVREIMGDSHASLLAHDYGGAGNIREAVLTHGAMPVRQIVPFTYATIALNKSLVSYTPPGVHGARKSWTLDKARSLLLLCELIKTRVVELPDWDMCRKELDDFFSIYETSMHNPRGSPRQRVDKFPRRTDDTVHAVNFLTMALFHVTGMWPDMAQAYIKAEQDDDGWTDSDL